MDADGFFTIVDRKKDVIVVSGFNVYPNEIEDTIIAVDGVDEVGVIGLPDERSGERVEAFVVSTEGNVRSDDIIAYCREHLAGYKVPQRSTVIDQLPKSPIGKILRRELRSNAVANNERGAA